MNQFFLIPFIALLLFSCNVNKKKQEIKEQGEASKYLNVKDELRVFDTLPKIEVKYSDSIIKWKGYYGVRENLYLLRKTTANEVLSNAETLVLGIKLMKDSIPSPVLKERGMIARINGLYNQALRLQEMQAFSAVTVEDIIRQTQGMFALMNTIDKKINSIYDKIDFENKMIEDEFFFSLKDSIF